MLRQSRGTYYIILPVRQAVTGNTEAVAGHPGAVAGNTEAVAEAVAGNTEVVAEAVSGNTEAVVGNTEAVAGNTEAVAEAVAGNTEAVAGQTEAGPGAQTGDRYLARLSRGDDNQTLQAGCPCNIPQLGAFAPRRERRALFSL